MTGGTVQQQEYSFEDYLSYDDGTDNRYELVEGRLERMNPPTGRHSLIPYVSPHLLEDNYQLSIINYQLSIINYFCVVSRVALSELLSESAVFQTPPFLVVEIVSQESVQRDYRYKRSEYAALGIPEYWIVDPLQNQVTVLLWEEGLYEETVFERSDRLSSRMLPELRVSVEEILCL